MGNGVGMSRGPAQRLHPGIDPSSGHVSAHRPDGNDGDRGVVQDRENVADSGADPPQEMLMRCRHIVIAATAFALLAGCDLAGNSTGPIAVANAAANAAVNAAVNANVDPVGLVADDAIGPYEISIDGATLTVRIDQAGTFLETTVPAGEGQVFTAWALHPDRSREVLDVALVASDGERHTLQHVRVDADAERFVTHLMDLDLLAGDADGSAPAIVWTPDAGSIVWIEALDDTAVLRATSFGQSGPSPASGMDVQRMTLDAPADVDMEEFRVDSETLWTLLLRDRRGGDLIEVPMGRRTDGLLMLPPSS